MPVSLNIEPHTSSNTNTYRKPGGSCSYVSHHYKSQCSQVYNYHRLLSWDKERGLHMDIYKVRRGTDRVGFSQLF